MTKLVASESKLTACNPEDPAVCRGQYSGAGSLDLTFMVFKLAREMRTRSGAMEEYRSFLIRKITALPGRLRRNLAAMEKLYAQHFGINPLHGFICWQLGIKGAEKHISSGQRTLDEFQIMQGMYWGSAKP